MNGTIALTPQIAQPARPSSTRLSTWIGLFVSLFGMLLIREGLKPFFPAYSFAGAVWREGLMFALAAALLFFIKYVEKQPLSSIGLRTSGWAKSLLWGLVTGIMGLAVAGAMAHWLNYGHGAGATAMDRYPLWLVMVIVIRAGIVEELCYRGYAIERLQSLGLGKWAAVAIPLVIFSAGHWTGGAANIAIAFVLGAMLTGLYVWRRDLPANMFAHFFVDFVGNVLPRLLA